MNSKPGVLGIHTMKSRDLFKYFDSNRLDDKKYIWKRCGKDQTIDVYHAVFVYCLFLIFLDIVETGCTFMFPLFRNKEAYFEIKQVDEDLFKRIHKANYFKDLNLLETDFKGYILNYRYDKDGIYRNKEIYIVKWLKEMFIDNINNKKINV